MSGSVNKVILVGRLARDPEIRSLNSVGRVCNLSVATSETWRDKASGEKKEKSEFHRVVIFNDNIVKVCENYLKKGSTVYLEGSLVTRKYEQSGVEKYATEVVIQKFNGQLVMLGGRDNSDGFSGGGDEGMAERRGGGGGAESFGGGDRSPGYRGLDDSDIPFARQAGHGEV